MSGAGGKIGFAVVGLGSIAQNAFLPALSHHKNARLVALVSRDLNKAKRLARKFGPAAAFTVEDFPTCLANPQVDAVYVATPPGEHERFTVMAAEAKKHVLCEKPLAASVEQAARMVRACHQHNVFLMTAYRKYFEPGAGFLKDLIRRGKLGRIEMIQTSFTELYTPGRSPGWLTDPILAGGGPLTDLGIYCVNTTRWLMDEDPVEVTAQAWRRDTARFQGIEEGIAFRLHFPGGLMVQAATSYASALSSFIHVHGSKGWASLTPAYDFTEPRQLTWQIGKKKTTRTFKVVDEFALELDAFAAAVHGHQALQPDGVQGHRDMVILQAIYEAANNGKAVPIRYA